MGAQFGRIWHGDDYRHPRTQCHTHRGDGRRLSAGRCRKRHDGCSALCTASTRRLADRCGRRSGAALSSPCFGSSHLAVHNSAVPTAHLDGDGRFRLSKCRRKCHPFHTDRPTGFSTGRGESRKRLPFRFRQRNNARTSATHLGANPKLDTGRALDDTRQAERRQWRTGGSRSLHPSAITRCDVALHRARRRTYGR